MKHLRPLFFFASLLLVLTAAACDSSPVPPPTVLAGSPTPEATPTSVPTSTPRPFPSVTPVVTWRYSVDGLIVGGSTLSNDGRAVYFGSQQGEIFALDAATGEERWKTKVPGAVVTTPAYSSGTLYLTATFSEPVPRALLLALDPDTGRELWSYETDGEAATSPVVEDGLVYLGSTDSVFYVVDASTGEERWRFRAESQVINEPVVSEGAAYTSDITGNFYSLDADSGSLRLKLSFPAENRYDPAPLTSAAVDDGTVYFASTPRATLYAVDALSGRQLWEFDATPLGTPPAIMSPGARFGVLATSPPAVAGDSVYVGISFGEIGGAAPDRYGYLYALDRRTGKVRWRFEADNEIYSQPVARSGALLFLGKHGTLYALDASTGRELWQFSTGGPVHVPVTISSPGDPLSLYVGTWDGTFYRLGFGEERQEAVVRPR